MLYQSKPYDTFIIIDVEPSASSNIQYDISRNVGSHEPLPDTKQTNAILCSLKRAIVGMSRDETFIV